MEDSVHPASLESITLHQITGYVVLTVAVAGLVSVALDLVKLARQRFRYEQILKAQKVPGPPQHWFWGIAAEFEDPSDAIRLWRDWTKQYGAVQQSRLGPFKFQIFLNTPDAVKAVMNRTDPKEPQLYGFFRAWIGDGLLLSFGEKWQRNRRLLTPAFHFEILKPYISIFSDSAQVLIKKWRDDLKGKEGRQEMFHHMSLMTLDNILKCALGYESNCQTEGHQSPYIKAVYELTGLILRRFVRPIMHIPLVFNLSPDGFRFRRACNVVHDFSRNIIKARKEAQQDDSEDSTPKKYLDFLDILMKAKDEDGRGLTDEEIQQEVDTFMFGGHDTTASGLSWFLYNMARFPEHQEKCRNEIMGVLEDGDDISWDDLHKMDYLTLCIKESLRIHPPVPNIGRRLMEPVQLPNNITIPSGMWVSMCIYALHHNPEVWPDPETYDPLRFTHENAKGRSSYAFVPFSAGPRNCIGQNFAMNELKVTAALLLKHFKFTVDESVPVVLWPELIMRSKDGIWLKVTPRD